MSAQNPHPTMRDVADLAGVSPMTVSRALHNDPNVAPSSVSAVLAAVDRLGYRRNEAARVLRTGRPHDLLGLVITNLANPFYAQLAVGVERFAAAHGQRVVIGNSADDPGRERELLDDFRSQRVSGLVVVPSGPDQRHLAPDVLDGVPVALAARPPRGVDLDCVLVDDTGGARDLTASLVAVGHKRIGFIGLPTTSWAGEQRLDGHLSALAAAGIGADADLLGSTDRLAGTAEDVARRLLALPRPPTALVAANNRITVGAYRAIRRYAQSTALAGFDDLDFADLLGQRLTVAAYDPALVGETAAALVLDRLRSADSTRQLARRRRIPVVVKQYRTLGDDPAVDVVREQS